MNFQFKTFNQFFKFETPIHNKQNLNLNLEEGQLERGTTWIFNSWHSINFQNLELLSTKNKIWIWTWTRKRVNLNNGQFEFPIFKTWKFKIEELEEGLLNFPIHPQNTKFKFERGSTWISKTFNQFSKFGTPIHKKVKRESTWISNSRQISNS